MRSGGDTYGMTERQADLLRFIASYMAARRCAPSLIECRDALGLKAKSQIHYVLRALEERGHIRRIPGRARSIEVTSPIPCAFARDGNPLIFIPASPAGRRPAHVETAAPANRMITPVHGTVLNHA